MDPMGHEWLVFYGKCREIYRSSHGCVMGLDINRITCAGPRLVSLLDIATLSVSENLLLVT